MTEESRPYINSKEKELKETRSALKAQVKTIRNISDAGLIFSTLGGITSVATFTTLAAPLMGTIVGLMATASLIGSVKATLSTYDYMEEIKAIKKEFKIRKKEDMLAKRKEKLERRRKHRKERRDSQKDFGGLTIASIEKEINKASKTDVKVTPAPKKAVVKPAPKKVKPRPVAKKIEAKPLPKKVETKVTTPKAPIVKVTVKKPVEIKKVEVKTPTPKAPVIKAPEVKTTIPVKPAAVAPRVEVKAPVIKAPISKTPNKFIQRTPTSPNKPYKK